MIPILLRLKKASFKEIAKTQDLIVETLYSVFDDAVLHGGTAIWRCYKGNRFSEDIDVYITRDVDKLEKFYGALQTKGMTIEKKKLTDNSLFSTLRIGKTIVRFEALFKKTKAPLIDYEKADGNVIVIPCLSAEELIREKVNAYLNRLKVRDLYDIFFLLRKVYDISAVKKELNTLLMKFKNPLDEKNLKSLIIEGLTPSVNDMLNYIGRKT